MPSHYFDKGQVFLNMTHVPTGMIDHMRNPPKQGGTIRPHPSPSLLELQWASSYGGGHHRDGVHVPVKRFA